MKAECLDFRNEADEGFRHGTTAARVDAAQQQPELTQELLGSRVSAGRVARREPQTAMDERQLATVGLGDLARADCVAHVGKFAFVVRKRFYEFCRYLPAHGVLRESSLERFDV